MKKKKSSSVEYVSTVVSAMIDEEIGAGCKKIEFSLIFRGKSLRLKSNTGHLNRYLYEGDSDSLSQLANLATKILRRKYGFIRFKVKKIKSSNGFEIKCSYTTR